MNYETLEKAFRAIKKKWPGAKPSTALICGSGWSAVIESFDVKDNIDYGNIPGLGKPGVIGHAGKLSWGTLNGVETLIFQGRRHYYEGEGWTPIALPIYVAQKMGVKTMVLTNSAGCVRDDLKPGDLMVIKDHINNMGNNPLIGPHNPVWGTRFPDQSNIYDKELRKKWKAASLAAGFNLFKGTYYASTGPTYESPAEVKAYKKLGAHAVGMSTLPEAILANASGMKVAGVSCLTNFAAGISPHALSHEEVTDMTKKTMPKMKTLLERFWAELEK